MLHRSRQKPPDPPRAAVCSRSKSRETPSRASTLHAPSSAADRDRLHRAETPSPRAAVHCRSRATPSRRNYLHALPSAADRDQLHRAETPSTRRRPLQTHEGLHRNRKPPPHSMSSRTPSVPPMTGGVGTWAREEVDRVGRNRDRAPNGKNSHPGPLWINAKSIMQNPWR